MISSETFRKNVRSVEKKKNMCCLETRAIAIGQMPQFEEIQARINVGCLNLNSW